MSQILQNALRTYRSGNYKKTLSLLAPILRQPGTAAEVLLVAAQCHAKSNQPAEAGEYYGRVAALKTGREATLLRVLAAKMQHSANHREQALTDARLAARGNGFDIEAEEIYRRLLQLSLCLGEIEGDRDTFRAKLKAGDAAYLAVENPLDHISWCDDEAINAGITRIQGGKAFTPQSRAARRARPHAWGEKLRIGYLSNDYSDQHATMRLFQGVILAHDPQKFEIFHFCYTSAGVISADRGLRKQYPNLVKIGDLDDDAAEKRIHKYKLDILVDLKGHTKDCRVDLVNRGLAPIQVAFLGFPGSATGIDCDYAITDPIVTPDSSKPFYHEKLCRLPETYQCNDSRYRALPPGEMRASLGLPEDKIIFASFNAYRKVTPEVARLWARVLKEVDDGVLWIMCDNDFAEGNFLDFMGSAGVSRNRIIFARMADYEHHVARLQAADIGLDTFPYNGHTTTSDKLWAGLPVVTRKGCNFASRVSESLMQALGVPELVAEDEDAYVSLCRDLAADRSKRAALREKIVANRFTMPLFDTERFTRHLETAYEMIADRARNGLEPDHIDVPALPPRIGSFAPVSTD